MQKAKRARLEARGWRVGDAAEFLRLSREEAALVALRVELARAVRRQRLASGWTQAQLAEAIGSSQSRVAKMEAGDGSVSIDLLIRTLLAAGASGEEIGEAFATIAPRKRTRRSA